MFAVADASVIIAIENGIDHLRAMRSHFVEHDLRLEAEDAGVPEETFGRDIRFGSLGVRFLDEPDNFLTVGLDVAECGVWPVRGYAQGCDTPLLRLFDCPVHGGLKCGQITNHMVGGKNTQNSIGTLCCLGMDGCRSDGGGGIPTLRLKQKGAWQNNGIQLVENVFRKEEVPRGRHGNKLHDMLHRSGAQHGVLDERKSIRHLEERFGVRLP